MSSLALDPAAAPTFIPPRSSSHGVAFPAPNRNSADQPVSPPQRKSSKRPVSNTSEGWLAQSSEKKPLTAQGLSATRSSRRHTSHSHSHSHSHRTKSALERSDEAAWFAAPGLMHMAPSSRPPNEPPHDIGDILIHAKNPPWSKEKEKVLLGPYDYLFGHPGKDIRAQLISAFNEWLRVPEESLTVITKVIGMLHTASLLVDDVEDSSLLRRGEPVAHNIFGIPQVINTANYVYFLALQELSTLHNPTAIQIFTEELLNLHRGQGMDLFWRDTLTCPTEADYLEMVSNKTGGLFRLAIKLMEAESSVIRPMPVNGSAARADANATAGAATTSAAAAAAAAPPLEDGLTCVPLINTIGLLFQVLDDLLNLSSPTYHARKGHAEDLTEGKFSFPVLHAVRADPSNLVLLNVLRQKTTDPEVKRYAVEYMQRAGSFDYTRRVIAELEKKAVREVGRLEDRIGGREGREGAARIRSILGRLKAL